MPARSQFEQLSERPGLEPSLLARIDRFVTESTDSDLFRVNLADWSAKEAIALPVAVTHFLHLTKVGVFDLSWDVHCPRCNSTIARRPTLSAMTGSHPCVFCSERARPRLDDHLEVTFTPNPAVREVAGKVGYEASANVEFFHNGPLAANRTETIAIELPPHVERVRLVTAPPLLVDVIPIGEPPLDPVIRFLGGEQRRLPATLPTGSSRLELDNRSSQPVYIVLENHDMREYEPHERRPRLTGLDVIGHPAFRELFGGDSLPADESLRIRDVTVVFTDVRGSTGLYRKVGDVTAYNLVREHFELLFGSIRELGGTVVKTIGDAVMASFLRPDTAVAAMLEVQRRFGERNADRTGVGRISDVVEIRVGIHRGTALAVTLNSVLDFFGAMVNEASRLEAHCPPGGIVVSDAVYGAEGVRALIDPLGAEPFLAQLKGISEERALVRVRIRG